MNLNECLSLFRGRAPLRREKKQMEQLSVPISLWLAEYEKQLGRAPSLDEQKAVIATYCHAAQFGFYVERWSHTQFTYGELEADYRKCCM
jgi:hypothetical protein